MERRTDMRFGMRQLVATGALLILAVPAFAQGKGSISGTVTAADSKAPVSGASVSVSNPARIARTDDAGTYALRGLPDGTYELSVTAVGREPVRQTVSITGGGAQRADVSLKMGSLMLSS